MWIRGNQVERKQIKIFNVSIVVRYRHPVRTRAGQKPARKFHEIFSTLLLDLGEVQSVPRLYGS